MYALIVEPQPRRVGLYTAAAEAEGLPAVVAATMEEVPELVAKHGQPVLCLVEWTLASLDGFRVLRELAEGGRRRPAAVVVSAFAALRDSAWLRREEFGIEAVLSTDLEPEVLVLAFKRALRRVPEPPAERHAEPEVRYALAHFAAMLAHLDQPVALWAEDGRLRLVNPALGELLQCPAEQMVYFNRSQFAALVADRTGDAAFARELSTPGNPLPEGREVTIPGAVPRIFRWSSKSIDLPGGRGRLDTWRDVTAERELARIALTDPLTGLANRRGGEEILRRESARALRSRIPLCVALLDIDHFKAVNDRFGHSVGDEVLRSVAQATLAALRASDAAARWGGEEFLLILADTGLGLGRIVCQRVRMAVEARSILPNHPVTVSIGCAEVGPGESVEAAIESADERLYAAKKSGRNRVL